MKFTATVEINKPIHKVVSLFDNKNNLCEWQEGFVSIVPIDGTPGKTGAKSRITFKNKKKHVIRLTETILTKNLPAEMKALYEHKHMTNTMYTRFKDIGNDRTKYEAEIEYTRFSFMPRITSFVMPGVFKKPVQKWLDNFKRFAEDTSS